jgi:hypothetical protein
MKSKPQQELELHPDAWARFERAAGVVAKSPPQHRVKSTVKKRKAKRSESLKIKA